MSENGKRIFGIDLGTTNSCISVVDEYGKPSILLNGEGDRITPSVVFIDEGNQIIVGKVAKANSKLEPDKVIESVKRLIGKSKLAASIDDQEYSPEMISSFILQKVVQDAAKKVKGKKITDVVITCPAYFGEAEREATKIAGEIIGLTVHEVINEPTAAALSYGMDTQGDQTVLVYDLGGGTFDVTMIEVKGGSFTVVCTGGNDELGGKNWDEKLVEYMADYVNEATNCDDDIRDNAEMRQDLWDQAENVKHTLTTRKKAYALINYANQRVKIEITREKFNELTADLLQQTIDLTNKMLEAAKTKGKTDFDKIILVGGSTRMPQVPERLAAEYDKPIEEYEVDEAVARGAALYGFKLAIDKAIEEKTAEDPQQQKQDVIDKVAAQWQLPPEQVGTMSDVTVQNVTSKTFGVVALDGDGREKVCNLIFVNTNIPANKDRQFGTFEDNQQSVAVRLAENLEPSEEAGDLSKSTEIGKAVLTLPAGLKKGSPIDVAFQLDKQGILQATAKEPTSGEEVKIEIKLENVMNEQQIELAKSQALQMQVS